LLLEGDDLEALLLRAATEGGPNCRIVRAEKVRRGGVMGFFAKEGFEVAVEIPDVPVTQASAPTDGTASAAPRLSPATERFLAEASAPLDPDAELGSLTAESLFSLAARIDAAEQATGPVIGAAAQRAPGGPTGTPTGTAAEAPRTVYSYSEDTGGTPAVGLATALLDRQEAADLLVSPSGIDLPDLARKLSEADRAEQEAAAPLAAATASDSAVAVPTTPGTTFRTADGVSVTTVPNVVHEPAADPAQPSTAGPAFTALLDQLRASSRPGPSAVLAGAEQSSGGVGTAPLPGFPAPLAPTSSSLATNPWAGAALPPVNPPYSPNGHGRDSGSAASVDLEDDEATIEIPAIGVGDEPPADTSAEAEIEDAEIVEDAAPEASPAQASTVGTATTDADRTEGEQAADGISQAELDALLGLPENLAPAKVRRPVDTRLAADRRTLRGLGVPGTWTRRLKAGDRFSSVLGMLAQMPELDADPDVPVVAVVGLPGSVQLEAHRIAVDLAVGNRPRRVLVVPTDDPPQRDAALDTALHAENLVAAVETLATDAAHAARVRTTLRQLRAQLVIVVVDATQPLEETRAWLAGIGRVDALAVENATEVSDPAAALRLDLPVVRLDGIPVDRVTWTALLCAQLDLAERAR
jgi:hypothetical protein